MENERRILIATTRDPAPFLAEIQSAAPEVSFQPANAQTKEEFAARLSQFLPEIVLISELRGCAAGEAYDCWSSFDSDSVCLVIVDAQDEAIWRERGQAGRGRSALAPREHPWLIRSAARNLLETKRALETLRESGSRYGALADSASDGLIWVDDHNQIMESNPAAERILGYASLELKGKDLGWLLREPARTPDVASPLSKTEIRKGSPKRKRELLGRHKSGALIPVEAVLSEVLAGGKRLFLCLFRGLADLAVAPPRQPSAGSDEGLATFVQFNPNPVFEFDEDGALLYFNRAAEDMAQSLQLSHPSGMLPPEIERIVRECLAPGPEVFRTETSLDGRAIAWLFFAIQPIRKVHCYAREITERVTLEAQMRQAQKMEIVGRMAAGVAHDFNNNLTVIKGHCGILLAYENFSAEALESLKQITEAAARASNLTRQLMTLSRKQILEPRILNINDIVSTVIQLLKRVIGEDITLQFNYSPGSASIFADPGMIEQVLMNLAINARDAMPRGGQLTISTLAVEIDESYVQTHREAHSGRFMRISIEDTGCGMDAAVLSRLFEPFFTTKGPGKGTGLGLATAYGIVKQHEGWMEVNSQVGRGTIFRIFLPSREEPAETITPAALQDDAPPGTETLLLVEDEQVVRQLAAQGLRRYGYQVFEAGSGPQALAIWRQRKEGIDLLLTDMVMPQGWSGQELADKLMKDKPRLKVVYISGYSTELADKDLVLREDVMFLAKPFNLANLAKIVREALDAPG